MPPTLSKCNENALHEWAAAFAGSRIGTVVNIVDCGAVEVVGKQVLSNLNSASWAEGSVEVEGRQLPCRALLEGSREQRRTQ